MAGERDAYSFTVTPSSARLTMPAKPPGLTDEELLCLIHHHAKIITGLAVSESIQEHLDHLVDHFWALKHLRAGRGC